MKYWQCFTQKCSPVSICAERQYSVRRRHLGPALVLSDPEVADARLRSIAIRRLGARRWSVLDTAVQEQVLRLRVRFAELDRMFFHLNEVERMLWG